MSKTTPVRWWRDDAQRYRPRGAYVAPPVEPTAGWDLELLIGPASQLEECLALIRQRMIDAATLPYLPFILDEDRHTSDPRFATGWRQHLLLC